MEIGQQMNAEQILNEVRISIKINWQMNEYSMNAELMQNDTKVNNKWMTIKWQTNEQWMNKSIDIFFIADSIISDSLTRDAWRSKVFYSLSEW